MAISTSNRAQDWLCRLVALSVCTVLGGMALPASAQQSANGPDGEPQLDDDNAAPKEIDDRSVRERLTWLLSGYHFEPSESDLADLGEPAEVAEALRELASEESMRPSLRARAVDALAHFDTESNRSFLKSLLESPSDDLEEKDRRVASLLRHHAISAVARMFDDQEAVGQLEEFLSADDLQLRLTAVSAIGKHAGAAGRQRLEQMAGSVNDQTVRREVYKYVEETSVQ